MFYFVLHFINEENISTDPLQILRRMSSASVNIYGYPISDSEREAINELKAVRYFYFFVIFISVLLF